MNEQPSSLGHLYLPMKNGGIFRDEYFLIKGALYLSFYAICGATSPLIQSSSIVNLAQLGNIADTIAIVGAATELIQVVSKNWKKFRWEYENPEDVRGDLWPKTIANAKTQLQNFLINDAMCIRSDLAYRQNERIIENAKNEFLIFRVAFSEDLVMLYRQLDKTKQGCSVELNLASADALRLTCQNELIKIAEMEKNAQILTKLESEYDVQARSKYLKDANANFARAACDSLCAIRAAQNYVQYDKDAKRFKLNLYDKEPSFRGTITDNEIAYVSTRPWAPGMMGDLHAHILSDENKSIWKQAKKSLLSETKSMKLIEHDYVSATDDLSKAAIDAIYQAEHRSTATRDDVLEIEKLIRKIEFLKPSTTESKDSIFQQIKKHRQVLRDSFGKVFPRLDEIPVA
jgi:hypothetical protein